MKVAWYHNKFPFGGGERVTSAIIAALQAQGKDFEPVIIAQELTARIDGVRFIELDCKEPLRKEAVQTEIIEILRREKPDVFINTQDPPRGMLPRIRAELPELKIIHHLHSCPLWQVKRRVRKPGKRLLELIFRFYTRRYKRAYRRDYAACNAWVCLTKGDEVTLRRMLGENVYGIYNPLTGVKPSGQIEPKSKEVIYVGRLTIEDKRVDRLLRIWSKVHPLHQDWQLKLIGSGRDEAKLRQMAEAMNLRNVEFCGQTNSPEEHYATASILCLTSEFEGWGLVLTEALANGVRPVAMTCGDGVREIIESTNSQGIRPGDEKEFARVLSEMMSEPSAANPTDYEEFINCLSSESTAKRWSELLHKICGE